MDSPPYNAEDKEANNDTDNDTTDMAIEFFWEMLGITTNIVSYHLPVFTDTVRYVIKK
jgi:hypothetical protein